METNLAVLIDFENIAAGTEKEGLGRFDVEALMQRVKDKGRILVARSYADWGRFSRFKQALLAANVTMMELTSHGMQDKNRADIAMVVDALELAFTKDYIDTFVVVSGDSDFTPMVLKMRELNKRVIGCGTRKSTSRLLIQACDEFFFYDTIAKPKKTRTPRAPKEPTAEAGVMTLEQAFDLLEETLDGLQRENPDPPLASVVKTAMLRKSPDFSETDLGFGSYARFLEAAQDAGIVRIVRDQKSGGYRVDSLDTDLEAAGGEAPPAAAAFDDTWLPDDAERFLEPLREVGIDPLSAPTRMAVLEAIHDVVSERKKRRRKATIPHVAEDVRKALRRTHPDLPLASIRGVLEVLLRAGQLIHRDGTAIRSANASFRLQADAQALNKAFTQYCLAQLIEASVDVSDSDTLAALFLGDADRRREIEETIAWLQAGGGGEEVEAAEEIDLDDLLVVDTEEPAEAAEPEAPAEPEEAAEEAVEAAAEDKPKKKRKRTRRKKDADAEAAEAEAAEAEAEAEPAAAEEAPQAEPAKAEAPAKAEPAPAPEEAAQAEAVEETPKPKRRTTRTRKKAAEPTVDLESDLDKLLQPSE